MSRKTRKLMWSVPLIAAVAVIGALAAFMMLAPGALFADGTLGQPGLMAPEAEGPRSIMLTWTAPAGATPTGYRIDVSKDAHVWSELVANHSGTEYVHTLAESDVLTTGTQPVITARYYRVFALNSHGVGDESDIKRGDTKGVSAPDPVETVSASATGANSIRVTWEAPEDDGGMSITGYRVVQSLSSSGGTTQAEITLGKKAAATATSMTIETLLADTQYYFRVYAVNDVDTGGVGVPAGVKTRKASRPSVPTNVVALQTDPEIPTSPINLYWLEPASNGGRPITDYIIEFRVNSFPPDTVELVVDVGGFPTGAGEAANYVHTISDTDPGDETRSLARGDRVSYLVYAKHADATSRASSRHTVTIIDTDDEDDIADGEQGGRPIAPTSVTASTESVTPGRIELTWTHTLRTGYRIDVSANGMVWQGLESSTNLKVEQIGTTRRYIHNGLTPGAMRHYRVFGSDGGRLGIPGINTTIGEAGDAEAPSAPAGSTFSARAVSSTQINLAWTAPRDTGGRDIGRYLLEIDDAPFDATAGDVSLQDVLDADADAALPAGLGAIWVSETSYQHKGLSAATRYYYRLRSDNSSVTPLIEPVLTEDTTIGTITPVADAAQQTAETNALSAPAAPHSLSTHQGVETSSGLQSEQGVYLTWLTAKGSGGPVDEYEVMRVVADEDDLEVSVPASSTNNGRTFYNDDDTQASLDNKERRYRVRAVNEAGESAWTDWVAYPLADHIDHVTTGVLGKPTMVAAVSNAAGQATITWQSGMNADSHDVVLYSGGPDYNIVREAENVTGMSHTFTGVAEGRYAAVVISAMGDDMWDYSLVWVVVQ